MKAKTKDWLRQRLPLLEEDLRATYARNLQKWLVIAPVIGVASGLAIAGVVDVVLRRFWPAALAFYLRHHWAMVPGLAVGGAVAGLLMQYLTSDPNEHSTEEVIRAYHEHEGQMDLRGFLPKILAAVMTVGSGGSTALEGPGIYGGAVVGSWLWGRLQGFRRLRLTARDRRIMLICGAAAGMSAVFRAPLTGIVFALEMPYKDDLAHEAVVPSLIASVVSYATLTAFLGSETLFNFASSSAYTGRDLVWCALLGLVIGLAAMVFVISFRRLRRFVVRWDVPHWTKPMMGGALAALCGLLFLVIYPGTLVPIGTNYEVVGQMLTNHYATRELLSFTVLKLAATAFTIGSGGVSAMFVPMFLSGEGLGLAFAQSVAHSSNPELYAAVGMAAFIAGAYKTPLAAVVFVAEATGGHGFVVPALVGAAVAYLVSGDASTSPEQRVHGRGE